MLAAVLVEQNKPLQLHELQLPRLSYGQVLVRVICSGICGSQLAEVAGVKGADPYLPHLLGHEACGDVLDTGPGVTRVKAGDRVVLHWRKGPGLEAEPAKYVSDQLGIVNSGWVTTFSEQTVVSENRLTPIAIDIPPPVAALMGCAVTTGAGVVNRDARVELGESVLVLGSGGVGLSVLQSATLSGALPIVMVDRYSNRLRLALQLGADRVVDTTEDSDLELSLQIDGGYDVVVECTGHVPFIELAYRLASPKGRVVLVGVPRVGEKARLATLPLHFGRQITGSHGGGSQPDQDIPRYLKLFRAGRLDIETLVSKTYALNDVNRALADMRNGSVAGRCILSME